MTDPIAERLDQLQQQLDALIDAVDRLNATVVAFTGDGRPLSASVADPFALAYLLVAAHGLSRSLATDHASVGDILKGSATLAESLIRELDTYRSRAQGESLLQRLFESGPDGL